MNIVASSVSYVSFYSEMRAGEHSLATPKRAWRVFLERVGISSPFCELGRDFKIQVEIFYR